MFIEINRIYVFYIFIRLILVLELNLTSFLNSYKLKKFLVIRGHFFCSIASNKFCYLFVYHLKVLTVLSRTSNYLLIDNKFINI